MGEELKIASMFIELDVLFDTRISILGLMGDVALKNALDAGYHSRPIDMFPNVDNQEFAKLYSKRDKEILKESLLTSIAGMIKDFAVDTLNQLVNSPFHAKPKIVLNTYPYILTEEEDNILIASIAAITNNLSDVEVVHLSYEQITPSYIKENIEVIVLYEYYKWLEIHCTNMYEEKITCPEVTMLGPEIYFKPKDPGIDTDDPFKAMEELAGPFIGLVLLPIEVFSFKLTKKA